MSCWHASVNITSEIRDAEPPKLGRTYGLAIPTYFILEEASLVGFYQLLVVGAFYPPRLQYFMKYLNVTWGNENEDGYIVGIQD